MVLWKCMKWDFCISINSTQFFFWLFFFFLWTQKLNGMADEGNKDFEVIKIMMLGDPQVGKTSLLLRYTERTYTAKYISTLGVDFKQRPLKVEGKEFQVQVWDTAGQERFRSLTSSYFQGAHGFVLVCDLTDPASFENIKTSWVKNIREYAPQDVVVFLIGNKQDLNDGRKLSAGDLESFAQSEGFQYAETSAKVDIGVDECFEGIAKIVAEKRLKEDLKNGNSKVDIGPRASEIEKKKSGGFFSSC